MKVISDTNRLNAEPIVSVFCNAYNQENYIAKCLDGFLMQETSFPFEVLITDDASTDGTANIIREYVKRRPDIFVAILHDENQYSKGINHNRTYLFPRARGKYIAFCEGDDFWITPHKLQRQFEAMERCPTASWCVHASVNVKAQDAFPLNTSQLFDHDCILQFEDTGNQVQLAATASFFIRREAYAQYLEAPPSKLPCDGDYKMSRFFSMTGDTIYLAEPMSAYRVFASSSINIEIAHSKQWREIVARNTRNRIDYLNALNEWSGGAHTAEFSREVERITYLGLLDLKDYQTLIAQWPEQFARETLFTRAEVKLLGLHPAMHDMLRSLRLKYFPYLGMRR